MDIGQVSKLSGLPASTLRYYEERGLIRSIGRNGLRRVFAEDVLEKLALIALGRRAGLSLEDIGNMLLPDGLEIDRVLLLEKAAEFEQKIAELTAVRDGLRHVAKCPAPTHMECPKFLRLLNIVERRGQRPR